MNKKYIVRSTDQERDELLRCLRFLLFKDALPQSWPLDPVHFDGGANDLTGQPVSFRE